jgi:hypothetical protein
MGKAAPQRAIARRRDAPGFAHGARDEEAGERTQLNITDLLGGHMFNGRLPKPIHGRCQKNSGVRQELFALRAIGKTH